MDNCLLFATEMAMRIFLEISKCKTVLRNSEQLGFCIVYLVIILNINACMQAEVDTRGILFFLGGGRKGIIIFGGEEGHYYYV